MATQREIAEQAKTSLKTVSRVINRDPLVNAKTRARVEAIIAEVAYEPSQAARMLRSQRSNIIGFLADGVATTSSSFDLIRGAQDVAWERGKQMMLFNIERNRPSASLADNQLAAFRAEAVIYAAIYHQQVEIEDKNNIPHVLLNCFDGKERYPCVLPDDYKLAYDLTMLIIDRGYRRPVFLNLPDRIVASRLRARGFIDAAAIRGLSVERRIFTAVEGESDRPTVFIADQLLPRLLIDADRPDILLCGQDILAMNVYSVLSNMGVKVGRDMAVASFDNFEPIASLLQPGLSTMELPYYEMGRAAMGLAIDGAVSSSTIRLAGRFIDRSSL